MKYSIDESLVREVEEEFRKNLPEIKQNIKNENKEITMNYLKPYLSSFALLQQVRSALYLKVIFTWIEQNDFAKAKRELEELEVTLFRKRS